MQNLSTFIKLNIHYIGERLLMHYEKIIRSTVHVYVDENDWAWDCCTVCKISYEPIELCSEQLGTCVYQHSDLIQNFLCLLSCVSHHPSPVLTPPPPPPGYYCVLCGSRFGNNHNEPCSQWINQIKESEGFEFQSISRLLKGGYQDSADADVDSSLIQSISSSFGLLLPFLCSGYRYIFHPTWPFCLCSKFQVNMNTS